MTYLVAEQILNNTERHTYDHKTFGSCTYREIESEICVTHDIGSSSSCNCTGKDTKSMKISAPNKDCR